MIRPLVQRLRSEMQSLAVTRKVVPYWMERGVDHYSCAIHSVGVTYWCLLGYELGYSAVAEMPAPARGRYAHVGDDVRSDNIWFEKTSADPLVIVEFERYLRQSDEGNLLEKAANLLLAHQRWGDSPRLLVLAYWTKGLTTYPNSDLLKDRVRGGFETLAGEKVIGSNTAEMLILRFILREPEPNVLQLWQVLEQGGDG